MNIKNCLWGAVAALLGLALLLGGWLLPIHLRAVEFSVLERAGKRTPTLAAAGLASVKAQQPGPARWLLTAARLGQDPEADALAAALAQLARAQPVVDVWGAPAPAWSSVLGAAPQLVKDTPEPFSDVVLRVENRAALLDYLAASPHPGLAGLLALRRLTNTVIFPPSTSASGQALDAAIAIGGMLLESELVAPALAESVQQLAATAAKGGSTEPVELMLLDFMSLGQRLDWGALTALTLNVPDAATLRQLANEAREGGSQWPGLYSAAVLTGRPGDTVRYCEKLGRTGPADLVASLATGTGGVNELLQRNQPLFRSPWREQAAHSAIFGPFISFAVGYCWLLPRASLWVKWLAFAGAGWLFALAYGSCRAALVMAPAAVPGPGITLARQILFALGFLLVVLIVSEPFLSLDNQKVEASLRLRLPRLGGAAPAVHAGATPAPMTQPFNLLILFLFFVLQGLIYLACLGKLAEIRRQAASPRLKLKLLENEEHLFDAGLYLGFAGTIICLILASLGVIKGSLMAAYSSTSFGIVFVSVFKIFQLRPTRRALLLQADAAPAEDAAPLPRPLAASRS